MIFKRRKPADRAQDAGANDLEHGTGDGAEQEPRQDAGTPGAAPGLSGPFDGDDFTAREGYVDLGSLLIEPVEGMQLRLEVEDKTKRVIAVALELDGSRLQLQTFAAPKSEQLWPGIQQQITASIEKQGGRVDKVTGRFGEELVARVPAKRPDGTAGFMVARFLGYDGGRWFLRGVIGGPAALDRSKAQALEEIMARAVVVRGDQPMPPSELLPLKVPEGAVARHPAEGAAADAGTGAAGTAGGTGDRPEPPERGPETTQIG
ncbi:DUF3710 domain-containing protein [Zhihengliuella sp.]|uniref:DUF3710 domain-containing protein n=1 Tax=Zhihengliuella sp. TaxID=1954483 RepID=UPI002811C69B|nr:DUF3710 domain-containing protein [Zhihengliuella sp.]